MALVHHGVSLVPHQLLSQFIMTDTKYMTQQHEQNLLLAGMHRVTVVEEEVSTLTPNLTTVLATRWHNHKNMAHHQVLEVHHLLPQLIEAGMAALKPVRTLPWSLTEVMAFLLVIVMKLLLMNPNAAPSQHIHKVILIRRIARSEIKTNIRDQIMVTTRMLHLVIALTILLMVPTTVQCNLPSKTLRRLLVVGTSRNPGILDHVLAHMTIEDTMKCLRLLH